MSGSTSLPILSAVAAERPRTCAAPKPRPSRMGRWRMGVLILIHLLAFLHIAHWYISGESFTAVEPSETVYMFTQGAVNVGAILFGIAILGTLIFGRFFCGWGCHIIFMQDACTALLKRIGFRPKPFRSRLLVFVPLGAALYMFAWPAFYRHVLAPLREQRVPPYEAHFTTEHLWDTFPGLAVSILTLVVCSVVVVYLLGNKGYCTYACPYGGFFGLADLFAPGKIRVTDACEQCGHCTAACTSNVRVHEEVHRFGMVVSPGCMKCLDCVDVCPKNALYVGFGRPAFAAGPARAAAVPRAFDFTWFEEFVLVAAFAATFLIVRGLYDAVPFLLALGVASISAFLLIHFKQSFSHDNLRLHRWPLRRLGRTTSGGWVFRGVVAGWVVFLAHSAFVQDARKRGTDAVNAGREAYAAAGSLSPEARTAFERGRDSLARARAWGFYSPADQEQQLGSALRYLGDQAAARAHFERAVEEEPRKYVAPRFELAIMAGERNDPQEIERQLRAVVRHSPEFNNAAVELASLLARSSRTTEAIQLLNDCIRRRPTYANLRVTLAQLQLMSGNTDQARATLAEAARALPDDPTANLQHLFAMAQSGDVAGAQAAATAWLARHPESAEGHQAAADISQALGHAAATATYHREEAATIQRARAASGEALKARRGRALLRSLEQKPASDDREADYLQLLLEDAVGSAARARELRQKLAGASKPRATSSAPASAPPG